MERLRNSRFCAGVNLDGQECLNDARRGHDTCRWHDPVVLAARAEAAEAKQRMLKAAWAHRASPLTPA